MFRSATFKLTMWYLAIVVAISLVFSVVIYHFATAELAHSLQTQSQRIYTRFPVFDNDPFWQKDTDYDTGSHRILIRLIDFNALVFVLAGFASYGLARRTLRPIEVAHEQQKRFTADVSHELRTPLTALKMESEVALMNKKTNEGELREVLESNLEEAGKMEVLVNNLMRLTKLDAGQIATNFGVVSSRQIAEEALSHVQKTAIRRHITLTNKAKSVSFTADYDSLVQLLVILLDNALKYSPDKTTVRIEAVKQNDKVVFTVKDEGHGIPRAALPHVFDRFYRADAARTNSGQQGHGLGLSIAKLIADVHHGTITLSSIEGKGTTAIVSLPLQGPTR